MRQRKEEVWAKWRGLVAEQSQSGQSIAAFCRGRVLKSGQFFAWKKRLRGAEAPQFVAVEVVPLAETKWSAPEKHGGAIEVRLRGGGSLVVEPRFDAHHLHALVSLLEAEA